MNCNFYNESGHMRYTDITGNGNDSNYDNLIMDLKRKITLAQGEGEVDLVIKNTKIVNVLSGEIHQTDVAVADGIFVGFGDGYEKAKQFYDAQGRYMCPGLIDGHIHIESTFLSPSEFCSVVAPHGTSAVICDPHEIANVIGFTGLDYFVQSTENLPVKVYLMMPSCVPATHMETSGALITSNDTSNFLKRYPDRVIGLGEMMDYPGVVSKNEEVLAKLVAAGSTPKDGHAPLLSGKRLNAYIIAGLGSDHECTNAQEAMEKIGKGMHIMIRHGTHEKNLKELIPVVNDFNSFHVSLVSDDREPIDLRENGHMDCLVRSAIYSGLAPIRAIQMASINTAKYFGLSNLGAIAPGFVADFILLDNLESFKISQVFLNGKRIEKANAVRTRSNGGLVNGNSIHVQPPLLNTMHIKTLEDPNIFTIRAKSKTQPRSLLRVIGVIPGQIVTQNRTFQATVNERHEAIADPARDLAKLGLIERHHRTGNVGLGFVHGLGLERGAIASSVAHDSHNLIIAGMNDVDMWTAARYVSSIGGGLAVCLNKEIISSLPLPIAGLMSDSSLESVISGLSEINESCIRLGEQVVKDPLMLLSFLALPVIPSLKLTDKGLVDVDNFQFTDLWTDSL
jgi:adenine deaminase